MKKFLEASSKLQRCLVVYFVSDNGDDEIEEDAADIWDPH